MVGHWNFETFETFIYFAYFLKILWSCDAKVWFYGLITITNPKIRKQIIFNRIPISYEVQFTIFIGL